MYSDFVFLCIAVIHLAASGASATQGPSVISTIVRADGSVVHSEQNAGATSSEHHPGYGPYVRVYHSPPTAPRPCAAGQLCYHQSETVVAGPSGTIHTGKSYNN